LTIKAVKKPIAKLQAKSARANVKVEDDSDDSMDNSKPLRVTESMADFFKNSGPLDSTQGSKNSIKTTSNSNLQRQSPKKSIHADSNNDISTRNSPKRASNAELRSKNKNAVDSDSDDDKPKKKESSLAEFLASSGPEDYRPIVKPPAKKSLFGFSSNDLTSRDKSKSANSSKEAKLNEKSNSSLAKGLKKAGLKPSPLAEYNAAVTLSKAYDEVSVASNSTTNSPTRQNFDERSKDLPTPPDIHKQDAPVRLNSILKPSSSINQKEPLSRAISMKTTPLPNPSAYTKLPERTITELKNAPYLSEDSFASLPNFGNISNSPSAVIKPAEVPVSLFVPLVPKTNKEHVVSIPEIPVVLLSLSKVVKELTSIDSDYRKVFVAPSEKDLPLLVKKTKKYACIHSQTEHEIYRNAMNLKSTMSQTHEEVNLISVEQLESSIPNAPPSITTKDNKIVDGDEHLIGNDSRRASEDAVDHPVLQPKQLDRIVVESGNFESHIGRQVSLMADAKPSHPEEHKDTIQVITAARENVEEVAEMSHTPRIVPPRTPSIMMKSPGSPTTPIISPENVSPRLSIAGSVFSTPSDNEGPIMVEETKESQREAELLAQIEILQIELCKEQAKREKVDMDRRVMHYQYDKLIRLTHKKLLDQKSKE